MTYREETEGLKTRLEETERELAEAREKIARLEGVTAPARAQPGDVGWMTGAPSVTHLDRELPFEVSDEGYEAIAEVLRARLPGQNPRFPGMGQVSQVGRTLTYTSPAAQVRVSRGGGRTTLHIELNHRGARVGGFIGMLYGSVFASLLVTGMLKGLAVTPYALLLALPLVVVLTVTAVRRLARGHVEKQSKSIAGVLEAMVELGEKHAKRAKPGRRIEVPEGEEADAAAEPGVAEADADEVAAGAR